MKDYLIALGTQQKNLIPNSFNDLEYLAPYFAAPSDYDIEYGLIRFPGLALVSNDIVIVDALVRNCVRSNAYKWEKLYNTTLLEYNPIWNVDGTETETHDIGRVHTKNDYGNSSSTATASQVPDDMTTEKEVGKSETVRNAYSDEETTDSRQDVITRVRSGNIGVTKTQDMINDERKVAEFNYIKIIMTDLINSISYPYFEEV